MPQDYRSEERRRRIQAYKREKKKRRLKAVGIFLFIICIIGVGVGTRKLLQKNRFAFKNADTKKTSNYPLHGLIWEYNSPDLVTREQRVERRNFALLPKDVIRENVEIYLMPGKNHINRAESYAYSTAEIRDYIMGNKPYSGEKIAFLTFDDGPNNNVTPKVLDALKEENVPATFFLVGRYVTEKHKDVLMREVKEGHGIALHSFNHDYKQLYPGRAGNAPVILEQADHAQEVLKEMISPDFHTGVWRYPGGHMSWSNLAEADAGLKARNIEWIDWNVMNGDAEVASRRPTTPQGLVDNLNRYIELKNHPRVLVVLMHDADSKEMTAQALPGVIQSLRAQGYSFGILE